MSGLKNKFTLKIILSYLVLGTLAVVVGWFLFAEVKNYSAENNVIKDEKKIIETGTLINLLYKTDGFYRLALITEDDNEFESFMARNDSLFDKIDQIKSLTTDIFQRKQLDSIKILLEEKIQNIEQLRILVLTNQKETTLDDIMDEVRKLESTVGLASVESMVRDPSKLTRDERRIWQSYADYLNSDRARDTSKVKSKVVDSMLIASRYIVAEAKKENSRIRRSLRQKENELIRNDLKISEKLREIIASFDAEIVRRNNLEAEHRAAIIDRAGRVLKIAGIIGVLIILLFSYYILADFFRAERFKKNLQEAKRYAEGLLKSREQLISTVSHDLKTPLNTIGGYSQLFENTPLTKKQHYYLSQITSSSHFISHLVDDLLDYSKLEIGKLSLDAIPFSLDHIVQEVGNSIKQVFPDINVALKIEIPEKIKDRVFKSDPLRIKQILNNLVGNAFKFTDTGQVTIRVDVLEEQQTSSLIEISIIDTGIGISKEKQHIIFEEFTQAEASIGQTFGGSGLGLAISKKLAQLLDGTLEVESDLGEGSTFTLTLPLQHTGRVLAKDTTSIQGLSAVVLDDDQAMATMLQETFHQMDINARVFNSYREFKEVLTKNKFQFDFVLTDIEMAETDGFSVLENLREGEIDAYRDQPVIAMTGSQEHPRKFFMNKGFVDVLRKPFSREALVNVLHTVFPNRFSATATFTSLSTAKGPSESDEKFNIALLESFLDTPEAIQEVLRSFYTQTNLDLDLLEAAVSQRDLHTIGSVSHRMLTMVKQLQATEIISILEKMEMYSEANVDHQTLQNTFEDFKYKTKALQHALKETFDL